MATTTTTTNKPLNPRAQDLSPKGYNRANIFSGKALDFDGVNDSVTTPNLPMQSSNTWAIVMNINITQSASTKYIFDGREAGADGFGLYIVDNTTRFNYYSNGTDNITTYNFPASEWFNLAIVRDGADVHFYNNGIFVETITHSTTYDVTGDFYIGQRFSGIQFLDGQISGFKSFSVSLTAAQVADLYLNPEKIVPDGVASSALKLWLPMMEGAGTTAYDGSGNGNHGTINGATWVSGIGAPVAQTALVSWNKGVNELQYSEQFDNVYWTKTRTTITANDTTAPDGQITADKLEITTSGGLNEVYRNVSSIGIGSVISIYVKKDTARWFALGSNAQSTKMVWFDLDNGVVGTESTGYTGVMTDEGNGWYRCGIIIGTGAATSAYIDMSLTNSDAITSGDLGLSVFIWVASIKQSSSVQPYIPTLATAQTSPVLLPQGLTANKDITGVNAFESARNAFALNLDGASWAEVHDNASVDLTTALTLEAWVYWDGSTAKGILGRWNLVNNKRSYLLYTSTPARFNFYVSSNGTLNTNQQNNTDISTGWNHIAGVYDGANIITYLNGSSDGSKNYSSDIYANDVDIEIGRYDLNSANAYPNDIANPRIYNRALTAAEVLRNYNADKAKFGL